MSRFLAHPLVHALSLSVLIVLVWSPVRQAEFCWDDFHQIRDAEEIRSLASIPDHFRSNVRQSVGAEGANAEGADLYRPMFVTLLTLQYAALGGADPGGYHLFSVAWHLLVSLLLWALARRWLRNDWAAAAVAVLFAFHPVCAEAVVFVSSLTDLAAAAGLLGATLLLDRAGRRDGEPEPSALRATSLALVAAILLLVGLLNKEVILMALPPLALWLWLGRGVPLRLLAPLVVVSLGFLGLRAVMLGGLEASGGSAEQRLQALIHTPLLFADGLRALVTLNPVGYRELAYEYTRATPGVVAASTAVSLLVAAVAGYCCRRRPLLAVGLGVYFLMLAPVALVTTIVGWGGFGRYLYLPWAFVLLGLAEVSLRAWPSLTGRLTRPLAVTILVGVSGYLTLQQVQLRAAYEAYWSEEAIPIAALRIAPDAATGYVWIGNGLMNVPDLEGAKEWYIEGEKRALDGQLPPKVQHNIAVAYLWTGHPEEARIRYEALEARDGPGPRSSFGLACSWLQLGRFDEAADRLLWALDRAPDDENLLWAQQLLLNEHPDPTTYRGWLRARLDDPDHAVAAGAISPMLAAEPPPPRQPGPEGTEPP